MKIGRYDFEQVKNKDFFGGISKGKINLLLCLFVDFCYYKVFSVYKNIYLLYFFKKINSLGNYIYLF